MFSALTCLAQQHDWALIALAGVVCFSVSIVAISIFHRALASQGRTKSVWLVIAGGATGYGIWATHFIAMLAYDPGVVIGYGVVLTGMSLASATILTSFGFGIAASNRHSWNAPLGGAIVGAGIASMHYLGMAALELPGHVTWALRLVVLSIIFGVFLASIAMTFALRFDGRLSPAIAAAVFLTLAIISHHFIAMGAVQILPDPQLTGNSLAISENVLALAIAGVAISLLGMSLIGVVADRRLASRTDALQRIIDQRLQAQEEVDAARKLLLEQKFRLDTALEYMSHGLCMFDQDETLIVCNRRYADMYSLTPDETKPGTTLREILEARVRAGNTPKDIDAYIEQRLNEVRSAEAYYAENSLRDGRIFAVSHQPISNGGWVAIHHDITSQKRAEAQVAYMARHDSLTGVANRAVLCERMQEALVRLRRRGDKFSLLMIDLDLFKDVNDLLGHPIGDELLKEVAQRILASIHEADTLARLGGDEFAILALSNTNQEDAARLATQILQCIAAPFEIDGHAINIRASTGIALAPEHGSDADELMQNADLALYRSKYDGRDGFCFFDD